MPADHTGNGTAPGLPPDAGPASEDSPVVRLPVDGDAINAASVTQPLKALANWTDWLVHPRGHQGSYELPVMRYRNSRGHTRFLVDHQGMPGGRVRQWDGRLEDASWPGDPTGAEPVAAGGVWRAQMSSGTITPEWPNPDMPVPHVTIGATIGVNNAHAFILSHPMTWTGPQVAFALEWEAMFDGPIPVAASRGFYMGLWLDLGLSYSNVRGLPTAAISPQHILIFKDPTHANLKVQSKDEAGAETTTTGVSADSIRNTWTRFRLQFSGEDVADNNASRLDAFINGALVATHTGNFSYPGGSSTDYYDETAGALAVGFSVVTQSLAGAGDYSFRLAAPRLTTALYAGDVI